MERCCAQQGVRHQRLNRREILLADLDRNGDEEGLSKRSSWPD
jgi:hypothetical protein